MHPRCQPNVFPVQPQLGLTPWQLARIKAGLRQSACSENWVDAQFISITQTDAKGQPMAALLFHPKIFPPGGKNSTNMRWCRCCGRYTPPQNIALIEHRQQRFGQVVSATLQCEDCRIADDWEEHRELYQAGLHLRPAGSQSFVRFIRNNRSKQ